MSKTLLKTAKALGTLPARVTAGLLTVYQKLISPAFGPCCRYSPSCSHYAARAVKRHGAIKGCMLTLGRLLSCHPFSKRPFKDPVPEQFAWREIIGYKRKTAGDAAERS